MGTALAGSATADSSAPTSVTAPSRSIRGHGSPAIIGYRADVNAKRSTRSNDNVGTGLIVGATAFSALGVLVFQALGSRTLGADGFAPIAVLWTVMFLIYTVLNLPAEQHLTRALVVNRDPGTIRRVRRDMIGAFGLGFVLGVGFVILTLDRFFESNATYIVITAAIMVSRAILATGRGSLAGHRRFAGYAGSVALEAGALLIGGAVLAASSAPAVAFAAILAVAPLATLLGRPFANIIGAAPPSGVDAQPRSFLVWLIFATAASQIIIAGGPIAVGFVGGTAAAVSIFFTSFSLLRGPVTSAYNLVARVLPDFTNLAHGADPMALWRWAPRIAAGGGIAAALGAVGAALMLGPIVSTIYGEAFVPPQLAATLGGAGVGLGLGALFATQVFSAAARGPLLAAGWSLALIASLVVIVVSTLDPINRVALAFVVGEATGLLTLGVVIPIVVMQKEHRVTDAQT